MSREDEPRTKAVIDGVLQHVSVSQIQTFDVETYGGCERKWWLEKVAGLEVPGTRAQGIGTAGHAEIEAYLTTGVDTLGAYARAGKHFMPDPATGYIAVEHDVGKAGFRVAGVPMKGYIDLLNWTETYRDNEGELRADPGTVEVLDWKFTSNLGLAKTAAELLESVQMLGYAEYVRLRPRWDILEPLARIRLSHGVFQTQGAKVARKTTVTIDLETVAAKWKRVEGVVERMKRSAALKTVEEVPANLDACDAYRGCYFAKTGACPRTAQEKLSFLGGNHGMSLLNRFKSTSTPAAPPATTPAPAPAERAAAIEAEVAKLEAEERAAKGEPNVILTGADAARAAGDPEVKAYQTSAAAARAAGVEVTPDKYDRAVGVVPPDALVSAPPRSAEPIPPEQLVGMHPAVKEAVEAFQAEGAQVELKVGSDGQAVEVKRKRGRPPGAKNKPPAAPPTVAERDAIGAALDQAVADAERETAPPAPPALMLFVDVITSGIAANDLEPYINRICDALAAEYKAVDIRCAPEGSPLSFGKWKGALAACVRAEPPASGAYTVTDVRGSEIRETVVEALRPLAATYVRGR